MMVTVAAYARQAERAWRRWAADPRVRGLCRAAAWLMVGFLFSGASLYNAPQTLTLGLLCAMTPGWPGVLTAAGGVAGYLFFWQGAAWQPLVWMGLGLAAQCLLGTSRLTRQMPLVLPAVAALIASGTGVWFLMRRLEDTQLAVYILRVALAGGSCYLFGMESSRQGVFTRAISWSLVVLALAQVVLPGGLGLGFAAAAAMCAVGTFPAAALAGLALDLARVTPVPMTAVLCLAFLLRLVPRQGKWFPYVSAAVVYLPVMVVCNVWDLLPLPGLIVGGAAGLLLPKPCPSTRRRGETAVAQVRLEMAAGVLTQVERILQQAHEPELDEEGLFLRSVENACDSCPCRKDCRSREEVQALPVSLLRRPYIQKEDLPGNLQCRKRGRLLAELRRGQEQLRHIRRERTRLGEYRMALVRQYHFLAGFLQEMSDGLIQPGTGKLARFTPEVAARSSGKNLANGDKCCWFAGVGNRYYVLLCDGMGTGAEAAQESAAALDMLRRLLRAGFPAEHALRSFNDLCVLRGAGGCSTVDLVELRLDKGQAVLYKWGAAPSYLLGDHGVLRIGTAAPPPGLSDGREQVERLSLGRGEVLVLTSDGLAGEDTLRRVGTRLPPEDLAAMLLGGRSGEPGDDATAAVIRLRGSCPS